MIKRLLKNAGLMIFNLAFVLTNGVVVRAQVHPVSPEAKAAFEQAEEARKKQDYANAIAFYRKAIELDPEFAEAHENFRTASNQVAFATLKSDLPEDEKNKQWELLFEKTRKELIVVYEGWANKNPRVASYQWMLGQLYEMTNYEKAKHHLQNAVRLDPKFARAYSALATISDVWGDEKKQFEYLKKASEAAPDNPSNAFYYAYAFKHSNPVLFRQKSIEVAERFPNDNRGAQALFWLAYETKNIEGKIALLERLKSSFPPEKFGWSAGGMVDLFDTYNKTNPPKALALAEEMSKILKEENNKKAWEERATFQKNIFQVRGFIKEKKYTEAFALLERTSVPRFTNAEAWHLAKAEALDGVGQTDKAYEGLLKLVTSDPTDAILSALTKYGAKLGETAGQVRADVRKALEAKAKPVKEFSLARYGDEKKISLSDYRGRVVLLNFWYPYCGPCRGEFPHLQKVSEKYGPERFVILAVNVHPEEDDYVLPYMKGKKFDFVPLRSNVEFAEREFGARGYPTNLLIDTEGRIVFKPGVIRGDEVRKLELQIEALLPDQ
jgi:thiol-disulfide isomerase/thioredoxin/Flp pilus assembly protein TadD